MRAADSAADRATWRVLGTPVHVMDLPGAVSLVCDWAVQGGPARRVCFVNAHACVTALREPGLRAALADADLNLPDGAPVAWLMRRLGARQPARVAGPDLMEALLARCAELGLAVYLLGGTPATLQALQGKLAQRWPALRLAGAFPPPFRAWSEVEMQAMAQAVRASGTAVLLVGLGCPKQEQWMAVQQQHLSCVMLGVGAAFDFHAGTRRRAPAWMRASGLEWLHRLLQEPRRLGPRYWSTHFAFVAGAWRQLRGHSHEPPAC